MEPRPRKLLDQVCFGIQLKHYSYRTEETYVKLDSPLHLVSQQAPLVGEMGTAEVTA